MFDAIEANLDTIQAPLDAIEADAGLGFAQSKLLGNVILKPVEPAGERRIKRVHASRQ